MLIRIRPFATSWTVYSLWNSPGQNTGGVAVSFSRVSSQLRDQPRSPAFRQIVYHLSHQGRSRILEWVGYPFSRGSSQPRNQTPESPALQADSLPAEQSTREALLWSKLPLKNHNVHFILPVFYSSRVGRSKQAATKENDSSEEIDVFQGSSPVNDENPQEETEEEEVSTVNVCVF